MFKLIHLKVLTASLPSLLFYSPSISLLLSRLSSQFLFIPFSPISATTTFLQVHAEHLNETPKYFQAHAL